MEVFLSEEKTTEQKQDLCGACGAKIGNEVLKNAFSKTKCVDSWDFIARSN